MKRKKYEPPHSNCQSLATVKLPRYWRKIPYSNSDRGKIDSMQNWRRGRQIEFKNVIPPKHKGKVVDRMEVVDRQEHVMVGEKVVNMGFCVCVFWRGMEFRGYIQGWRDNFQSTVIPMGSNSKAKTCFGKVVGSEAVLEIINFGWRTLAQVHEWFHYDQDHLAFIQNERNITSRLGSIRSYRSKFPCAWKVGQAVDRARASLHRNND